MRCGHALRTAHAFTSSAQKGSGKVSREDDWFRGCGGGKAWTDDVKEACVDPRHGGEHRRGGEERGG